MSEHLSRRGFLGATGAAAVAAAFPSPRVTPRRSAARITAVGLAWKIPGRAGDSPIIGAGQYTDSGVGAAGSTGRYPGRFAANQGKGGALRDTAHLFEKPN